MKYKVTIVSSGQPSANPRAVKEAITLAENNYNVTFIYCPLSPWADEYDKILFEENKSIKWVCAGYHQQNQKWNYYFARVRKKIWEKLSIILKNKLNANSKATILFFQELKAKALRSKADLYIAHNLGAIGPVSIAAQKYNAKCGFDAEDFHRGESRIVNKNTSDIENKYFPLMDYITSASPLIGETYKLLFPKINFQTINNTFSLKFLQEKLDCNKNEELNLFWFSQFIGPNRGIEDFIFAINICTDIKIKLNLMGNISVTFEKEITDLINNKESINFIKPGAPSETFFNAQKYDIGIASETGFSTNNDIALSNKLFTYLLSGNVILFSNTKAQEKFHKENEGISFLYQSGDINEIVNILKKLYADKVLLNSMKLKSLELAKSTMNWEFESKKFLSLVKNTLN